MKPISRKNSRQHNLADDVLLNNMNMQYQPSLNETGGFPSIDFEGLNNQRDRSKQQQLVEQYMSEEQRKAAEQQNYEKQILKQWQPRAKKADLKITAKDYIQNIPQESQWKRAAKEKLIRQTLKAVKEKYGEFTMSQKVEQQSDKELLQRLNQSLKDMAHSKAGTATQKEVQELDYINYEDFLEKSGLIDLDPLENQDGHIYDGQWKEGKR